MCNCFQLLKLTLCLETEDEKEKKENCVDIIISSVLLRLYDIKKREKGRMEHPSGSTFFIRPNWVEMKRKTSNKTCNFKEPTANDF